jgi:hypothetical protein
MNHFCPQRGQVAVFSGTLAPHWRQNLGGDGGWPCVITVFRSPILYLIILIVTLNSTALSRVGMSAALKKQTITWYSVNLR